MRIGIVGAGFAGLAAAWDVLKAGHEVEVFDGAESPGGLAIGYRESSWDWTLEQYYHHWFTSDKDALRLAKEVGHPVLTTRPKTSVLTNGRLQPLDSVVSFLRFPDLSMPQRLRMLAALGMLRMNPFWKPLESRHAMTTLPAMMGEKAFRLLWDPLLTKKFSQDAADVSLAWFWARLRSRTPSLAYPAGGFQRFADVLVDNIRKKGGHVHLSSPIRTISPINGKWMLQPHEKRFDAVIATSASPIFADLSPSLPETYKSRLRATKMLGALTLVLRLRRSFLEDGSYWVNVCDKSSPLLVIVEHTNFMNATHYNNEHLLYVGQYLPHDHPNFQMDEKTLLSTFLPHLNAVRELNPNDIKGVRVFRTKNAQPVVGVNYAAQIPPIETPLPGLFLANMQQVYPWDRGTNYAIELGSKAVRVALATRGTTRLDGTSNANRNLIEEQRSSGLLDSP